ncbi:MAG: hypothetical protein HY235_21895 [Acidobacteria bacterium]|nr:hypothetical protein [Acidobacteriota bacterium]
MKNNTFSVAMGTFVIGLVLAAPCCGAQPPGREVDAIKFLLAFRAGKGDQYKGYTVRGEGREFFARSKVIDSSGKEEIQLTLTLAVLRADNTPAPVGTSKDWVQAEIARKPMLALVLCGPSLKYKTEEGGEPPVYSFRGLFTGDVTTNPRFISLGTTPDSKGSQIPVLIGSVVK